MHLLKIAIAFSILILFSYGFQTRLTAEQLTSSGSEVLSKIIANYLIHYFDGQEFVSFVMPSSIREQSHFQDDFIRNLFDNLTLSMIDHDILDTLGDTIHRRRSFNVILMENFDYLS